MDYSKKMGRKVSIIREGSSIDPKTMNSSQK